MAWQASSQQVIEETIRRYGVPGMVVAVARANEPVEVMAVGNDAAGQPLTPTSVLPVASITKMAVALGMLRLVARGDAALDDPLVRFVPNATTAREGVTLRSLLCHTSGAALDLRPESAHYRRGLSWASVKKPLLETPPALSPNRQVLYSNIGIGLIALVIETITGESLHAALHSLVWEPLAIEAWLGEEPSRAPALITGDLGEHAGSELEPYNSRWYRTLGFPWGGLLTTAEGALTLARAFGVAYPDFLPEWLRDQATRDNTGGLSGGFTGWMEWSPCPWGLGVEVRGNKRPHFTARCSSPATFGHIGWSGAAAWVDPDAELAWSIVGTRTWGSWASRMVAIADAIYRGYDLGADEPGTGPTS